jgi:hypothetical protein
VEAEREGWWRRWRGGQKTGTIAGERLPKVFWADKGKERCRSLRQARCLVARTTEERREAEQSGRMIWYGYGSGYGYAWPN